MSKLVERLVKNRPSVSRMADLATLMDPMQRNDGWIVVVSGETTYSEFASCVIRTFLTGIHGCPLGGYVWKVSGGGGLAYARNQVVKEALDAGAPWVWLLDDDHTFNRFTLTKLLARKVDVVVPHVLMRAPPHKNVCGKRFDIPAGASDEQLQELLNTRDDTWRLPNPPSGAKDLIEVGTAGCAGMLVRRYVFNAIPEPWFEWVGKQGASEDAMFCAKARRVGFKVFLDPAVSMGHLTTAAVWPGENGTPEVMTTFEARARGVDAPTP